MTNKELEALVLAVPDQAAVYAADLDSAQAIADVVASAPALLEPLERTAADLALDGVAHYVFNTLRGAADTVDGATFEDVRAIVAANL